MTRVILFNKPYGVLTQFTSESGHRTLKDFIPIPDVYAAGRLDADSEGLVVLTDDGQLQASISDPRYKKPKTYWVQVENIPGADALKQLEQGLDLGDYVTLPCKARYMEQPAVLWPRDPPIRHRAAIPTAWLEITLREGKNRQVRKMTAKVGHPTLRLVRWSVGPWTLQGLAPGEWRESEYSIPENSCQPRVKRRVIGHDARLSAGRVKSKS